MGKVLHEGTAEDVHRAVGEDGTALDGIVVLELRGIDIEGDVTLALLVRVSLSTVPVAVRPAAIDQKAAATVVLLEVADGFAVIVARIALGDVQAGEDDGAVHLGCGIFRAITLRT